MVNVGMLIMPSPTLADKLIRTLVIYATFAILGIILSVPAAVLLDLALQTGSSVSDVTSLFIWRYGGALVGLLLGGPLFDRLNSSLLTTLCFLALGSTLVALRFCFDLLTLSVLYVFDGLAMGVYLVGPNVGCVRIWGEKSGPFLQALWISSTIGAFITPLIARPFQLPLDRLPKEAALLTGLHPSNETGGSNLNVTDGGDYPHYLHPNISTPPAIDPTDLDIQYAFYIYSCMCYLMALPNLLVFIYDGCPLRYTRNLEVTDSVDRHYQNGQQYLRHVYMLLFLLVHFLVGVVEEIPSGVVTVFAVDYLHFSKSSSVLILTVFWASVMVGRLVATASARCLRPPTMMLIHTSLIVAGAGTLLAGLDHSTVILWPCIAVIAIGWGPQQATGVGWIRTVMELTSVRASLLFIAIFLGKMLAPRFVVFMSVTYTHRWFLYTLFAASSLLLVFQTVAMIVTKRRTPTFGEEIRVATDYSKSLDIVLWGGEKEAYMMAAQSMPCLQRSLSYQPALSRSSHSITLMGSILFQHDSTNIDV